MVCIQSTGRAHAARRRFRALRRAVTALARTQRKRVFRRRRAVTRIGARARGRATARRWAAVMRGTRVLQARARAAAARRGAAAAFVRARAACTIGRAARCASARRVAKERRFELCELGGLQKERERLLALISTLQAENRSRLHHRSGSVVASSAASPGSNAHTLLVTPPRPSAGAEGGDSNGSFPPPPQSLAREAARERELHEELDVRNDELADAQAEVGRLVTALADAETRTAHWEHRATTAEARALDLEVSSAAFAARGAGSLTDDDNSGGDSGAGQTLRGQPAAAASSRARSTSGGVDAIRAALERQNAALESRLATYEGERAAMRAAVSEAASARLARLGEASQVLSLLPPLERKRRTLARLACSLWAALRATQVF